jgi:hypothetical protein
LGNKVHVCWLIFHEAAESEAEAMLNGGGTLAQLAVDKEIDYITEV